MIISSVEVNHRHEDGPDIYRVGQKLHPEGTVIHHIEEASNSYPYQYDREYRFYDEVGNQIMRIENCPVVVKYKPE